MTKWVIYRDGVSSYTEVFGIYLNLIKNEARVLTFVSYKIQYSYSNELKLVQNISNCFNRNTNITNISEAQAELSKIINRFEKLKSFL